MQLKQTPVGIAQWPYLDVPDQRFNRVGRYTIGLKLSAEEAAPLIAEIESEIEASYRIAQNRADSPLKLSRIRPAERKPYCEDTEAGDGSVVFKFRVNPFSRDKSHVSQRPIVIDADNRRLPDGVRVGHGSLVRVSYSYSLFHTTLVGAGVALKLRGVKVMKLVPPLSNDVFGFAEVDANPQLLEVAS